MRNSSRTAKFFIICAVVFGVGLLTAALGAAFGGIDEFGKVAEQREWIQGDPGKQVKEYVSVGDFESIDIEGCADVNVMTEEWSAADEYKPGQILVVRGSKVDAPEIKTDKGVLYIKSPETEFDGINISFSDVPRTPAVFVYCTKEQLKTIKTKSTSGDLSFMGIRFASADLGADSGDIFIKGVRGEKLSININSGDIVASGRIEGPSTLKSSSGDIRLSGKFLGETTVNISSGDFSLDTKLTMEKYAVDVQVLDGDIRVTSDGSTYDYEDNTNKIELKGGPNRLTLQSLNGDVELTFGGSGL